MNAGDYDNLDGAGPSNTALIPPNTPATKRKIDPRLIYNRSDEHLDPQSKYEEWKLFAEELLIELDRNLKEAKERYNKENGKLNKDWLEICQSYVERFQRHRPEIDERIEKIIKNGGDKEGLDNVIYESMQLFDRQFRRSDQPGKQAKVTKKQIPKDSISPNIDKTSHSVALHYNVWNDAAKDTERTLQGNLKIAKAENNVAQVKFLTNKLAKFYQFLAAQNQRIRQVIHDQELLADTLFNGVETIYTDFDEDALAQQANTYGKLMRKPSIPKLIQPIQSRQPGAAPQRTYNELIRESSIPRLDRPLQVMSSEAVMQSNMLHRDQQRQMREPTKSWSNNELEARKAREEERKRKTELRRAQDRRERESKIVLPKKLTSKERMQLQAIKEKLAADLDKKIRENEERGLSRRAVKEQAPIRYLPKTLRVHPHEAMARNIENMVVESSKVGLPPERVLANASHVQGSIHEPQANLQAKYAEVSVVADKDPSTISIVQVTALKRGPSEMMIQQKTRTSQILPKLPGDRTSILNQKKALEARKREQANEAIGKVKELIADVRREQNLTHRSTYVEQQTDAKAVRDLEQLLKAARKENLGSQEIMSRTARIQQERNEGPMRHKEKMAKLTRAPSPAVQMGTSHTLLKQRSRTKHIASREDLRPKPVPKMSQTDLLDMRQREKVRQMKTNIKRDEMKQQRMGKIVVPKRLTDAERNIVTAKKIEFQQKYLANIKATTELNAIKKSIAMYGVDTTGTPRPSSVPPTEVDLENELETISREKATAKNVKDKIKRVYNVIRAAQAISSHMIQDKATSLMKSLGDQLKHFTGEARGGDRFGRSRAETSGRATSMRQMGEDIPPMPDDERIRTIHTEVKNFMRQMSIPLQIHRKTLNGDAGRLEEDLIKMTQENLPRSKDSIRKKLQDLWFVINIAKTLKNMKVALHVKFELDSLIQLHRQAKRKGEIIKSPAPPDIQSLNAKSEIINFWKMSLDHLQRKNTRRQTALQTVEDTERLRKCKAKVKSFILNIQEYEDKIKEVAKDGDLDELKRAIIVALESIHKDLQCSDDEASAGRSRSTSKAPVSARSIEFQHQRYSRPQSTPSQGRPQFRSQSRPQSTPQSRPQSRPPSRSQSRSQSKLQSTLPSRPQSRPQSRLPSTLQSRPQSTPYSKSQSKTKAQKELRPKTPHSRPKTAPPAQSKSMTALQQKRYEEGLARAKQLGEARRQSVKQFEVEVPKPAPTRSIRDMTLEEREALRLRRQTLDNTIAEAAKVGKKKVNQTQINTRKTDAFGASGKSITLPKPEIPKISQTDLRALKAKFEKTHSEYLETHKEIGKLKRTIIENTDVARKMAKRMATEVALSKEIVKAKDKLKAAFKVSRNKIMGSQSLAARKSMPAFKKVESKVWKDSTKRIEDANKKCLQEAKGLQDNDRIKICQQKQRRFAKMKSIQENTILDAMLQNDPDLLRIAIDNAISILQGSDYCCSAEIDKLEASTGPEEQKEQLSMTKNELMRLWINAIGDTRQTNEELIKKAETEFRLNRNEETKRWLTDCRHKQQNFEAKILEQNEVIKKAMKSTDRNSIDLVFYHALETILDDKYICSAPNLIKKPIKNREKLRQLKRSIVAEMRAAGEVEIGQERRNMLGQTARKRLNRDWNVQIPEGWIHPTDEQIEYFLKSQGLKDINYYKTWSSDVHLPKMHEKTYQEMMKGVPGGIHDRFSLKNLIEFFPVETQNQRIPPNPPIAEEYILPAEDWYENTPPKRERNLVDIRCDEILAEGIQWRMDEDSDTSSMFSYKIGAMLSSPTKKANFIASQKRLLEIGEEQVKKLIDMAKPVKSTEVTNLSRKEWMSKRNETPEALRMRNLGDNIRKIAHEQEQRLYSPEEAAEMSRIMYNTEIEYNGSIEDPRLLLTGVADPYPGSFVPDSIQTAALNEAYDQTMADANISLRSQTSKIPQDDLATRLLSIEPSEEILIIPNEDEYDSRTNAAIEYDLRLANGKNEDYVQLRGSQDPDWFPGYYATVPTSDGRLVKIESTSKILNKVWNSINPQML